MRDAIGAATRSNVAYYTIDPRGLVGISDDEMDMQAPPQDVTLGLNPWNIRDEQRNGADEPDVAGRGDRWRIVGQQQRLHEHLRPHRARQQLVLPARVLPDRRAPQRQRPPHPGQGQSQGRQGLRPQGVPGAQGQGREEAHRIGGRDVARGPGGAQLGVADARPELSRYTPRRSRAPTRRRRSRSRCRSRASVSRSRRRATPTPTRSRSR